MVAQEAYAVVAVFVILVLSNVGAWMKAFGGKDNKQISDEHPTYVTPDGVTFAIWGLIYTSLLATVVFQLLPMDDYVEKAMAAPCPITGLSMRLRLIGAFLSNAFWLPLFNNEYFKTALVFMLSYLGFLLSYYNDARLFEGANFLKFTMGVSMNTSWLVVAAAVNIFFVLGEAGWKDAHDVAGSVVAGAIVCVAVSALAIYVALCGDVVWVCTASWALRGIYRMQSIPDSVRFPTIAMSRELAYVACGASIVALLSACVVL